MRISVRGEGSFSFELSVNADKIEERIVSCDPERSYAFEITDPWKFPPEAADGQDGHAF